MRIITIAAIITAILSGCDMQSEPDPKFDNARISDLLSHACKGTVNLSNVKGISPDELNRSGKDGTSPLLWLIANCEDSQGAAKIMVHLGANPHLFNEALRTSPAIFAIRNLSASYTKAMLDAGMDPNFKYQAYADSPTLLHKAVMYRNRDAVKSLISHGADLESRNASGDTPLLFVRANQYDIALILLEAGADPFVKNNQGNDICHRLLAANYTRPAEAPDYRAIFVKNLAEKGVRCTV